MKQIAAIRLVNISLMLASLNYLIAAAAAGSVMGRTVEETYSHNNNLIKNYFKSSNNITKSHEARFDTTNNGHQRTIDKYLDPEDLNTKNVVKKVSHQKLHNQDKGVRRGISQIKSIYHNLKEGQFIFGDKNINTVRYIPSIKVETNNKIHFLFNLSLIKVTEKLIKPELYINKRYSRHRLAFNLHYMLYESSNQPKNSKNSASNSTSTKHKRLSNLKSIENSVSTVIDLSNIKNKKRNGWHMFNVQDSLSSYLNVRNTKQQLLKLKMQTESNNNNNNNNRKSSIYYTFDKISYLSNDQTNTKPDEIVLIMEANKPRNNKLNKFLFDEKINPYLLVYTNEDEMNMKKFFQNRLTNELDAKIVDELSQPNQVNLNEDYDLNEKSTLAVSSTTKQHVPIKFDEEELKRLKSFEDHVDKMNEKMQEENHENENDLTSSEIIKAKKVESEHSNVALLPNDISYYKETVSSVANDTKSSSSSLYYYPKSENYLAKGILDKSKIIGKNFEEIEFFLDDTANKKVPVASKLANGRNKKRDLSQNELYNNDDDVSRLLPNPTSDDSTSIISADRNEKKSNCDTQPILIDFEDLSFSDWIIEPKNYMSNYCSGICKLPFTKKITYSNYATIQSILNIINISNIKSNPPALCCTPSRTESLPILYIDTNQYDYVVKLLPDMIVKECACQ